MRSPPITIAAILLALCFRSGLSFAAPDADFVDAEGYAGSDRCAECHPKHYEGWSQTFHATVVQDAREHPEAVLGDFTQEGLGFTLDEVEYTIGGHRDQRYMKKIGDDYYVLPKLWNVQAQAWRPYNVFAWRKLPYSTSCKGCHVTGYDPDGNVPTAENRIGCEACHGPGWDHARTEGRGPIVHPGKISSDRRSMICAACHVRGKDKSGTYYFPVGFLPGEDLGTYYVPEEKGPEETTTESILRLFSEWEKNRGRGCKVCGLPKRPGPDGAPKPSSPMDPCFGCHAFEDRYGEHTHHARDTGVLCFDCHKKQPKGDDGRPDFDIHTRQYFFQHLDECYDRNFEPACLVCHEDRDGQWARQAIQRWAKPVEIDH